MTAPVKALTGVGFSFSVLIGCAGFLIYGAKGAAWALLGWSAIRVFLIGDRV